MARDIEEFLRRAAERKQQHSKGGQPTPPANNADSSTTPTAETARTQRAARGADSDEGDLASRRRPPTTQGYQQQPNKPKPSRETKPPRKSRTDSSSSFPATSSVTSNTEKLNRPKGEIAATSKKFEQQIFQHLDHEQARKLQDAKLERKQQAGTKNSNIQMTNQIRSMLARPETIAQAILISEIIKRPTFDDDE